ncbi:hypothetical protein, partial [Streptomyces sp. NPDC007000]|uniref:hypothetical protein n=1 Tax=Streptomyces sp. NPDC007000 TaxID=3155357 RepID=UPI0033E2BF68
MSTAILTGQPVPGSSLEADLRSLGFDVRIASGTAEAGALLAEVPTGQRCFDRSRCYRYAQTLCLGCALACVRAITRIGG